MFNFEFVNKKDLKAAIYKITIQIIVFKGLKKDSLCRALEAYSEPCGDK